MFPQVRGIKKTVVSTACGLMNGHLMTASAFLNDISSANG